MRAKASITITAAAQIIACLACASAISARDAGVPKINLQQRCEDSKRAMATLGLDTDSFDLCMKAERDALAKLNEAWNDISQSIKSQCVDPRGFSPSYIEWQSCVEVATQVRKQRVETPPTFSSSKNCPIIDMKADGSIVSVVACQLRQYRM